MHNNDMFEGIINGKRAQLRRYRGRVEVYREYADLPGLYEFIGYFDALLTTSPNIAAIVAPFIERHLGGAAQG